MLLGQLWVGVARAVTATQPGHHICKVVGYLRICDGSCFVGRGLVQRRLNMLVIGPCYWCWSHVGAVPCSLPSKLVLLLDPLLQRPQERCDHVEAALFDQVLSIALLLLHLVLPPQGR